MNGNNLLANLPLRLPVPEGPYMQATPEPLPHRDTGGMPPWLSGAHRFAMQQFLKVLADRERNRGRVPSWQMPYPMPATQGERDVLGMLPVAGDVEDVRYLAEGVREGDPAKMLMGGAATALPFVPASLLHTVYHGSPHIFDAFSLSKIGTGEGAQAYGHGLYFAESPGVAKEYQARLGTPQFQSLTDEANALMVGDRKASDFGVEANREIVDLAKRGDVEGVKGELKRQIDRWDELQKDNTYPFQDYAAEKYIANRELLSAVEEQGITYPKGALYTVDIPDEAVGRMLDWDKPLSEQPEALEAFNRVLQGDQVWETWKTNGVLEYGLSGEMAYKHLVGKMGGSAGGTYGAQGQQQAAASEALRQAGIPGIRYFDAMSRGAEEGTRNLVLFDESLATILERK